MSNNKGFLQRLTSWKNTFSLIGISCLACIGINALPISDISRLGVPLFFILTAVFLGLHFVGRQFGDASDVKQEQVKAGKIPVGSFEAAKDPVSWLRNCDIRRNFVGEIEVIRQTYDRIAMREAFFGQYDADSPFAKAYDLIKSQALSDIKSSGQFMSTYHPSSSTNKTYLYDLMKNTRQLADKLDQLVEEAISNQSVADDVDTSYVDDLLDSLQELQTRQI